MTSDTLADECGNVTVSHSQARKSVDGNPLDKSKVSLCLCLRTIKPTSMRARFKALIGLWRSERSRPDSATSW
jgi:hypothetical protein